MHTNEEQVSTEFSMHKHIIVVANKPFGRELVGCQAEGILSTLVGNETTTLAFYTLMS